MPNLFHWPKDQIAKYQKKGKFFFTTSISCKRNLIVNNRYDLYIYSISSSLSRVKTYLPARDDAAEFDDHDRDFPTGIGKNRLVK